MSTTCRRPANRRQRRAAARRLRRQRHALFVSLAWQLRMTAPVVIETPDGPIPLPVAIPHHGAPFHIPRVGDLYSWDDVHRWASSAWHGITSLFDHAVSFPMDLVSSMVDASISVVTTELGSFINLGVDYTATLAKDIFDFAWTIEDYFLGWTNSLDDRIRWLEGVVGGIDEWVIGKIFDAVRGIDETINAKVWEMAGGVEAWAIDNIYNPLLGEIEALGGRVIGGIASAIEALRGELSHLIDLERAERLAGILGLLGALAGVLDWVKECGAPMCEQFGPKTDFSKLWKLLQDAQLIALAAALASLTEAQAEDLARSVVALATGDTEHFIERFFGDGATVAGAIADTIGGLG